ncbi:hypothetical protein H2199_004770 [Coniosporium tulheliwenetii]|uniref:Uncharacterized protein n=1 Tax=Coniosporium tulheliwenetii TaxID=3383036 RepID=A0ACC2Z4A0_9PEZI|nr:hypothetical protein H2199_004770 [Cladosporium sp. JES 115]
MILILRVAQLHIGTRTTVYPFESLWQHLISFDAFWTLFCYCLSAMLFSEVYIWSAASDATLGCIDQGKSYERPRLNERPIYLRTLFICLAVVQSAVHLYNDYAGVDIPVEATSPKPDDPNPTPARSPYAQIWDQKLKIFLKGTMRVLGTVVVGSFIYYIFIRQTAYRIAFALAKPFFHLPKTAKPGSIASLGDLAGRFILHGSILLCIWEFANAVFSAYVALGPLKKDRPITDDSKDPNGTLLNGLKSRKTTWAQILRLCLEEINAIKTRIDAQARPLPTASQAAQQQQQNQAAQIQPLPRIADKPVATDDIFSTPPRQHTAMTEIAAFAKSVGGSPNARPLKRLSPVAHKLLEYGKGALSEEQQSKIRPQNLRGKANGYLLSLLRSPLGWPFRRTFARRVAAVVFGAPVSREVVVGNAVEALRALVVGSLKEDPYGTVAKDVPTLIRSLVSAITAIEGFVKGLDVDWTDVEFRDEDRDVPEVKALLETLKRALREVLGAFGEFLGGLGMGDREVRAAKEVASEAPRRDDQAGQRQGNGKDNEKEKQGARQPEMAQRRS